MAWSQYKYLDTFSTSVYQYVTWNKQCIEFFLMSKAKLHRFSFCFKTPLYIIYGSKCVKIKAELTMLMVQKVCQFFKLLPDTNALLGMYLPQDLVLAFYRIQNHLAYCVCCRVSSVQIYSGVKHTCRSKEKRTSPCNTLLSTNFSNKWLKCSGFDWRAA